MERNKNIDILRAIAILIIVIYHISALSGVVFIKGLLSPFIEYGGEYGVTLFFIFSGFAIYKSLERRKNDFKYSTFIKDRLIRILPEYYISIIIMLFFTGNIGYMFSKTGNFNIISHFLLIHGFFPNFHGAISGVAWTLTPIFCFYLISPFIFNLIKKWPKLTVLISIIFSCLFKVIIYSYFSAKHNDFIFYFTYGRSIFGAIDEFLIGMFLAKHIKNPKNNKKLILNILLIIISVIGLYFWIYVDRNQIKIITENSTRMSNCFEGYIWYTILTMILSIGIFGFSQIKINYENPISKFIIYISKHEYGIYLWHLEFIRIACQSNGYIQNLMNSNRRIIYIYLLIPSIFIGILMSICIDNKNFTLWSQSNDIISKIKSKIKGDC